MNHGRTLATWSLLIVPPALQAAEPPTPLAPFEVTTSRIKGSALPSLAPISTFTAADIERSGQPAVADFLRSMPWNAGTLNTPANAVSLNSAQTGVNFRGLGANNTLLLLNGRRVALFGQADGSTLSADVGNLPAAALESVEVLRDGAAALYGSDAIAGVVNVRLKSSHSGTLLRAGYRQFFDTDWSRRTASLTHGFSRAGTSLLLVLDYAANNAVQFSDRPVSRTEDLRSVGGSDLRQNFGWPGQLFIPDTVTSAPAAARGGVATIGTSSGGVVTIASPTRTVRAGDFVRLPVNITSGRPTPGDSQNNFDRAPFTSMIPAEESYGAFFSLEQKFSPVASAFAELGWRKRILEPTIHPTPAGTALESGPGVGDGPGGAILFPRQNPYNPFGVDFTSLQFQLVELGPRIREFTNETPRFLIGARGQAPRAWDWEVAGLYSANSVEEHTRNYITDVDLQAGLAGRLGGYINPFGPSDPGVIDRARTRLKARQRFRVQLVDAQATGEVFQLRSGAIRGAFGAEARHDDYRADPSDLAARGAYVAWSGLTRLKASRDIAAGYGELMVPLRHDLRAHVAARWENYSDFGQTTKPTYALNWSPVGWLGFRASRSEAFKAPEFLDLYANQVETYAGFADPRRPDLGTYTFRYRTGGNPQLLPEKSIAWNLIGSLRVPALPGFEFKAGWWRIEKTGMVGSLGLPFLISRELDPAFPTRERITRAASGPSGLPGEIVAVDDVRGNLDRVTVAGWDFDAGWRLQLQSAGTVRMNASASLLRDMTVVTRTGGPRQQVGAQGFPEWRARGAVDWSRGSWSVAGAVEWIGHHDGGGTNFSGGSTTQHARAFASTHFAWKIGRGFRATLTLSNLFDRDPPILFASNRGYATSNYDNHGRAYAISLERRF